MGEPTKQPSNVSKDMSFKSKLRKMYDDPEKALGEKFSTPEPAPAAAPAAPAPAEAMSPEEKALREKYNVGKPKKNIFGFSQGGAVMPFNPFDTWGAAVPRVAKGGKVKGPGGPTDDKVPALLSDGEYVLPAKTVKKVGVSALDKLVMGTNKKKPVHLQRKKGLRRFAEGGLSVEKDWRQQASENAKKQLGLVGDIVRGGGLGAMPFNAGRANFFQQSRMNADTYNDILKNNPEGKLAQYMKSPTYTGEPPMSPVPVPLGKMTVTEKRPTSEKPLEDAFQIAEKTAQERPGPGVRTQDMKRYANVSPYKNPFEGTNANTFMGSIFQAAINKGTMNAEAANQKLNFQRAVAEADAMGKENVAKIGSYNAGSERQRNQIVENQANQNAQYQQGTLRQHDLASQRTAQSAAAKLAYDQQEANRKAALERATAEATTMHKPLVGAPKAVVDPQDAYRRYDHAIHTNPGVITAGSPLARDRAQSATSTDYGIREQGTSAGLNTLGQAAAAVGLIDRRPDTVQKESVPFSNSPPSTATLGERITNKNIPLFSAEKVFRDETGAPIAIGGNTDMRKSIEAARVRPPTGELEPIEPPVTSPMLPPPVAAQKPAAPVMSLRRSLDSAVEPGALGLDALDKRKKPVEFKCGGLVQKRGLRRG